MKLVIISGSTRKNSESLRVAKFLQQRVQALSTFDSQIIDLHSTPFSVNPDDNYFGKKDENFKKISEQIDACDALILVSPEWSGMASPMLKALLIFIGKPAAFKPALIATVSSGRGGAYPVGEIQATGNKNNFITFLPEHLIFRDVNNLLKTDQPETNDDKYIRARSDYAIKLLVEFAKAHQQIRESGVINLETYPYGM